MDQWRDAGIWNYQTGRCKCCPTHPLQPKWRSCHRYWCLHERPRSSPPSRWNTSQVSGEITYAYWIWLLQNWMRTPGDLVRLWKTSCLYHWPHSDHPHWSQASEIHLPEAHQLSTSLPTKDAAETKDVWPPRERCRFKECSSGGHTLETDETWIGCLNPWSRCEHSLHKSWNCFKQNPNQTLLSHNPVD